MANNQGKTRDKQNVLGNKLANLTNVTDLKGTGELVDFDGSLINERMEAPSVNK